MNSTPHLFPALISSGLCGEQGVFLPQSAQSFAQGAQRGYGGDWCSTTFKLPRRLTATLPLYSAIHEIPHCVRNDEGEFNHSSSRGAMSAGDADEVVRVFSLCSKQACRLDFLLLFSQAIRREDKGRKWGISMSLEFFVLFFQEKSTENKYTEREVENLYSYALNNIEKQWRIN